jgi:antitoxin ParD1/3/4
MQTVNISLSDQLKEFVDAQIGEGRYANASEYLRELILDDEKRKEQERLEAMLIEGLESSESTEMTRQDWEDIRSEGKRMLEARLRKTG